MGIALTRRMRSLFQACRGVHSVALQSVDMQRFFEECVIEKWGKLLCCTRVTEHFCPVILGVFANSGENAC